jgi:uncharacterized protein (DUF4415 family)
MPKPTKSDLKRVQAMSDADIERLAIEDKDAQPMTDEELAQTKLMRLEDFMPTTKAKVCLRLDREVVAWFRSSGRGYQTKINAALRAFIDAQEHRT